jgi:hypothetical protein
MASAPPRLARNVFMADLLGWGASRWCSSRRMPSSKYAEKARDSERSAVYTRGQVSPFGNGAAGGLNARNLLNILFEPFPAHDPTRSVHARARRRG